jgi:hypothetical protein
LQLEHISVQKRLFIDSSKASWRQFYATIEKRFLLSHWITQFMWKKHKRTFRFCCKIYAMKNTGEIYVMSWSYRNADWAARRMTLNSAAFNVNRTAERGTVTPER